MCLLAKQRGAIRDFKNLWGIYPVIPPALWEADDSDLHCECVPTLGQDSPGQDSPGQDCPPETPLNDEVGHQSPVIDLSPPLPFRRGRVRGQTALPQGKLRY